MQELIIIKYMVTLWRKLAEHATAEISQKETNGMFSTVLKHRVDTFVCVYQKPIPFSFFLEYRRQQARQPRGKVAGTSYERKP